MTGRLSVTHQDELKRRIAARRAAKRKANVYNDADAYTVEELLSEVTGELKPPKKRAIELLERAADFAQHNSGWTVYESLYAMAFGHRP